MGKKKIVGRKPRFLVERKLIDEVCSLLEQGCSIKTTCQVVGLSTSAFHEWTNFGDKNSPDFDKRYAEFADRTSCARGMGKARLVRLINKHALTDGRIALEMLGRMAPEEYGKSYRRYESDGDGEPLPPPTVVPIVNVVIQRSPDSEARKKLSDSM